MMKSVASLVAGCASLIAIANTAKAFQVGSIPTAIPRTTTRLYEKTKLPFDIQLDSFKAEEVWKNIQDSRDNIFSGSFGERGEGYVIAQFVALALVAIGTVPLLGGIIDFVFGPLFLLAGMAVIVAGVTEIGAALSPWPTTNEFTAQQGLKTSGLYSYARHPMYAGLIMMGIGFAMFTGSTTRLLLTGLLWYVLHVKSDFEEAELTKLFGKEYQEYKMQVPGKFVPMQYLQELPWNKNNNNNK
jgi:protein-S-isoprenylcysteine O-methyltransferase Ste14